MCTNYWRLGSLGELLTSNGFCAVVNDLWVSHCTFKDVLFRIDTRLEFPHGTLLRYEHKSTVKELIKELVVSFLHPLDHSYRTGSFDPTQKLQSHLFISISFRQTKKKTEYSPLRRNEPRDLNPKQVGNPTSGGRRMPKQVTKMILMTKLNLRRRRSQVRHQR